MPIYEYKCERCGDVIEEYFQYPAPKVAAAVCKLCGGMGRRVISAPAVLKVNGFNAQNNYSKEG